MPTQSCTVTQRRVPKLSPKAHTARPGGKRAGTTQDRAVRAATTVSLSPAESAAVMIQDLAKKVGAGACYEYFSDWF